MSLYFDLHCKTCGGELDEPRSNAGEAYAICVEHRYELERFAELHCDGRLWPFTSGADSALDRVALFFHKHRGHQIEVTRRIRQSLLSRTASVNAGVVFWIVVLVLCAGAAVAIALLERTSRRQTKKMLDDFEKHFPDSCSLCSYQRWGQSQGIGVAFEPLPPHVCKEQKARVRALYH